MLLSRRSISVRDWSVCWLITSCPWDTGKGLGSTRMAAGLVSCGSITSTGCVSTDGGISGFGRGITNMVPKVNATMIMSALAASTWFTGMFSTEAGYEGHPRIFST